MCVQKAPLAGLADAGHRELDCMLRAAAAQMELGNFAECRRMLGDLLDRAPTLEGALALREIMVRTVRARELNCLAGDNPTRAAAVREMHPQPTSYLLSQTECLESRCSRGPACSWQGS